MNETDLATTADPISQGDILKLESMETDKKIPRFGLVINADCDLAHGKTDGVIAYLPIYSFREYLKHFWIDNYLYEQKQISLNKIGQLCKLDSVTLPDIIPWLITTTAEEVHEKIALQLELDKNKKSSLLALLSKLKVITLAEDNLAVFSKLCHFESSPHQAISKRLDAAKNNLGNGHLFLSEIAGQEELGFVIRFRRIYSLQIRNCYSLEASFKATKNTSPTLAFRIAKLTPTYKYRTAQLFSQQFSRIGLPDEIMELSELAIQNLADEILGVGK